MCASRGTKFSLMKVAVSWSSYDSASSRTQAPQAGAALKSISTGLLLVFASASAASASLIQFTFMSLIPRSKVYLNDNGQVPKNLPVPVSRVLHHHSEISVDARRLLPDSPAPLTRLVLEHRSPSASTGECSIGTYVSRQEDRSFPQSVLLQFRPQE